LPGLASTTILLISASQVARKQRQVPLFSGGTCLYFPFIKGPFYTLKGNVGFENQLNVLSLKEMSMEARGCDQEAENRRITV
jgi:hypothetical protein